MVSLFWISCAIVACLYVGYPALMMAWARLRPRPVLDTPASGAPAVSIVIAARNEGQRLANRIDNLLRLEHGGDRQIVVVSDGSTDDTLDVVARNRAAIDIVTVEAGGKNTALRTRGGGGKNQVISFVEVRQGLSTLEAPEAVGRLS